jgi:diguanylate cyclase (GGDEF)-like protein
LYFLLSHFEKIAQFATVPADNPEGGISAFVHATMRLRRLGAEAVLVCLLAMSASMQAQQYVFRAYRQPEGLKNLAVSSLAKDRFGYLWMGTENGVYRFLGSGFERFGPEQGIAELTILDVISDPAGTVWVTTNKNLYRWDGHRFLEAGRDPIPTAGSQRVAVEDAHHLLVVVHGHPYRLEHDAEGRMLSFLPLFTEHMQAAMPELTKIRSLSVVADAQGGSRVWAGCDQSLCSWQAQQNPLRDGAVSKWSGQQGLTNDHWSSVLVDHAGTLWAGGLHHVAVLPRGAARFADRSIPGDDPASIYSHAPLLEDREGRILAPAAEGIARWESGKWNIIDSDNGLNRASRILGMSFDAAGDLWFASRGDGLYQWTGYGVWEGWSDQQKLPSTSVWSIVLSNSHRIVVGTERGAAWIDPSTGEAGRLTAKRPWTYGQVSGMGVNADGSLWAGTASGSILRIDPKTGSAQEKAKLPGFVYSTFQDSAGRVFFVTDHGLYLRENSGQASPNPLPTANALLGGATSIQESCQSPDGADWFVSSNRVVRFKDGVWSAPPIDGLPKLSGSLMAISCGRDGALWITGNQTGTWRLTANNGRMQAWQLVLPAELRTLAPLAILMDRRGWLWLGTDEGLVVWNSRSWRHLTQEDGLIWNDVNQGILQEAPDGSLWIGTSGGLSHLLHPERAFDPIPFTVSLTGIQRGAKDYWGKRQLTLPWNGPPLHFQISSPTMRNRSELIFRYRMAGVQPEWTESHGNATFSRLDPGSYTFMAIACNPGLNACSAPVQVEVEILPPWWRSRWFYTLCILAFLLLLAVGDRLYARHLREKSRHLKSLVSERTRELEASREQLRIQATHDGLTGMLNRGAVLRALTTEMDRARREDRTLAVALIDLDHFKHINDLYGHLDGDDALRWFAAAVGAAVRPYDHAGRYGGEEFLLVLTEIPRASAEERLIALHAAITNLHIRTRRHEFRLNCSMGATLFDPAEGFGSVESLLTTADQALYAAKEAGRNRLIYQATTRVQANPEELGEPKLHGN